MHKWVVISVLPVGQTVTTDWESQTRWLENPSSDRQEEALIMAWHSDNVLWPASWFAVIQCQALQWKKHTGVTAQYHWFVMPWSCAPVMISRRPFFPYTPYREAQKWRRKNLICFDFFFLILWKSKSSLSFLLNSMENPHEGICVFSPFSTVLRKPSHTESIAVPALLACSFTS